MSAIPKVESIWMDGKFVPSDSAQVHVTTHCLHYGTGVFEGVRSYETPDGTAVFRLDTHLKRFFNSASLYEMEIPYSPDTHPQGGRRTGRIATRLATVTFARWRSSVLIP